jgi:hypothetical protein
MDWIKGLIRSELAVLMFLAGFVLLYLSFFLAMPNPSNGWTPPLRERPNLALLFIGILLCATSVGVALILKRLPKESTSKDTQQKDTPKIPDDPKQHPIVLLWLRLSPTQKEIVVFLYEFSHRGKLSFDDFYSAFCQKYGADVVPTADEMYFRLKTLEYAGLLGMESIAEKATDVRKITEVKTALLNGDIISTN